MSACKRDLAEDAETKKYPLASKHADSRGPSSNSMANSSSPSFSAAVLGCEANCQRRSPNRKPRSRSSRTAPRRELPPPPACIALQACSLSPVKLLNIARRCSCKARNVPSLRPLLQFGSQQPRRGGPVETHSAFRRRRRTGVATPSGGTAKPNDCSPAARKRCQSLVRRLALAQ